MYVQQSEKNRITAVLCCTAAGKLLPPFVIFKGKTLRPLKNVKIPGGVVCTTQEKAWMDENGMIKWIEKVWSPYVSSKPALLSLDTFSAHFTKKVMDAFAKCNTTLLAIPGGCTSVLQPLDISINKPFKSYLRQLWCQHMVDEAEKGVTTKITPASKSQMLEWIKEANDRVESKPNTVKKSFEVAGIVPSDDQRKDSAYTEINDVMAEVFGLEHMGYVEPDDDPFASCSSDDSNTDNADTEEDPFKDCIDNSDEEDPVTNTADTEENAANSNGKAEEMLSDESSSYLGAGHYSDLSSMAEGSDLED